MINHGKEELNSLNQMIANWKKRYLSFAVPGEDNNHVVQDFKEMIHQQLFPYLNRLLETEYLNKEETIKFVAYCMSEVDSLNTIIKELEDI